MPVTIFSKQYSLLKKKLHEFALDGPISSKLLSI